MTDQRPNAVALVPDGAQRRQVYGMYAGGADVNEIVAEIGLKPEQVGGLLQIISYQRIRAAQSCRDYDAAHGQQPPSRAGRLTADALRAAIRSELQPLANDVRAAIEAVRIRRPIPHNLPNPHPPTAPDRSADVLAAVRAVQEAVEALSAPAPAPPTTAPDPGRNGEILTALGAVQGAVEALAEQTSTVVFPGPLVKAYDAFWCPGCGSRYQRDDGHGCGPLVPVTVWVTQRTGG